MAAVLWDLLLIAGWPHDRISLLAPALRDYHGQRCTLNNGRCHV